MRSILAIVDKPGWSVDNQVRQVSTGLPQYRWTIVYHSPGAKVIDELASPHDLIWCANHGTGPKFEGAFSSMKHPRVLVTFRSWRYNGKAIPFARKYARSVTGISLELTAHLKKELPSIRYVSDSIPEFFQPSRNRRIGFVGEPDEYKGFHLIEKAVKRCGFELAVAPRVTDPRIGVNHPQSQMPLFYESCDAIVVASEKEGSGSIALEAMAMNIPVLTTRVGLAVDMDCLYIERTVDGIEDGLRRLFGRSKVFPRFSVDAVNSRYAELFEEMLK